jgi:hypothetical protein
MSKLLEYVRLSPFGATCDEIEQSLGLVHQTASAEIRHLVLGGKLTNSGLRRRVRSGRTAIVWRVLEASEALLAGGPLQEATRAVKGPIDGVWILIEWILLHRIDALSAMEREHLCRWWASAHVLADKVEPPPLRGMKEDKAS